MSFVTQSLFSNNDSIEPTKSRAKKNDTKFPEKLMQILSRNDISDIITWMPNGRSFMFLDSERFTNEILPNYFRKSKFNSFVRKLYRWGFRQTRKGPDSDSYFHLLFQKENQSLLKHLSCSESDPAYDLASSLGVPYVYEKMAMLSTEEKPKNSTPVTLESASAGYKIPPLRGLSNRTSGTSSEYAQFNNPIQISSPLRMEHEQRIYRQNINFSSMIASNLSNYNSIFGSESLILTNIPNYNSAYSSLCAQARLNQQFNFNTALQNLLIFQQRLSK